MPILRRTTTKSLFIPPVLLLAGTALSGIGPALVPALAAQKPLTLSFSVATRYTYKEGADDTGSEQKINAKVHVRGNNARVETTVGGRPLIVLYASPYVYRLLPSSKTGIRYQMGKAPGAGGMPANLTPQALLSNPASIRSTLKEQGAKKTGSEKLNGTKVDVYSAKDFRSKGQTAKAWLRQSDALPLRLEMTSSRLQMVASWSDYKRGHTLATSLFSVPSDYRVRDAAEK